MKILYNSAIPFIQNLIYKGGTWMLSFLSTSLVFIDTQVTNSYNKYGWFRVGIDNIHKYKTKMIHYLYNIKSYPEYNWNNMMYVIDRPDQFEYTEHYNETNKSTNEYTFMREMLDYYSPLYESENKNNVCLLSKFNDILCVQHTPIYLKHNDVFEKSNMSFLSITYSHPSMDEKIDISLSDNFLYCHNQLFNFAFVYHCLQYQDKPYIFDEHYKIEIMDSNVDTKEIVYNQYLHVYKDEFKIHSLGTSDKSTQ
jgi:hypothetical protein